jgi:signal peptidase I
VSLLRDGWSGGGRPGGREARRHRSAAGTLAEIPLLVVAALLVAFVVKAVLVQAFFIPSGSMLPQLREHDRVVVSKLSYRFHDPRRGDIVVFDPPPSATPRVTPVHEVLPLRLARDLGEGLGLVAPRGEVFIKRVIGLPGETVEGRGGDVYVNGKRLVEPYLPASTRTSDFPATPVPPGRLWLMGDNRGDSFDSRFFGPVLRRKVVGRTILRIWPLGHVSFL